MTSIISVIALKNIPVFHRTAAGERMKMADRIKQAVKRFQQISLSGLFIILVSVIVMITSVVSLLIFVNLYRNDLC